MPHTETHKRGAYQKGYSLKELGLDNFYQKWKDNELQIIDTEKMAAGVKEDWDRWSSPDANIHERRFKKLLIKAGDTYSDMRTIDSDEWKEGWKDPVDLTNQLASAGILRGFEAAGWLSDKTLGAGGRWVGKNILGLDEGNQQLMGIAAQFAAPSVIKQIPKLPKVTKQALGSRMGQNFLNDLGVNLGYQYRSGKATVDFAKKGFKKVNQKFTEKFSKDPSKRVVNVKAESIIDDAMSYDTETITKARNIYKHHPDAGWTSALTRARQLKGITNKGLIKDFTSGSLKKRGLFDPNRDDTTKFTFMTDPKKYQPPENFSGITPPTFDQARQKINRAIGNDVFIRHADGVPRFDFVKLQNNKVFTSEYKRLIGSDISTIDEFGLPFAKRKRNVPYESRKAAFVNYRKELMDQYLEWYGPAMKRLGIKSSDIDLDHRLTLIQSLGIYHNVDPKSQLWIDIQNTAVKRGIYPGDAKRNLDLADPESHRVKSNYFNDLHGLTTHNNMKYWGGQHRNSGKTRLQIMEESHLGPEYEKLHLEVVNDYFDVAERGNKILDSARAMWKAENLKGILPEEIVTTLMQVSIDPKYSPKQLNQIVKSMMDVEIEKYSKFQRLFQIEEELDLINASPETILDTDPQDIKDLKKEWKQLKTVRKSKWFKKHYEKMMDIRDKEIASPQRNIFELLEFLFPDD